MVVVQIDGLSGTGKSTLAAELIRRGHRAVDADTAFAYFGDPITGRPSPVRTRSHWLWDVGAVRAYCARHRDTPVFVCGGAMNQDACADLFAHRLVLHVDDDTLRHRLRTRTTNDFGKDPRELAEQLELNARAVADARRDGWSVVDATPPVADVATEVLRLAGPPRPGAPSP